MNNFEKYKEEHYSSNYITIKECEKGGVYRIHSRNLSIGVYDGNNGFIGIREKFGSRYLFTEYHWDQGPPYGTVKPFELITRLPEDIPATERNYHCPESADWANDPQTNKPRPSIRRDLNDDEPPHGKRQGFVDEWADTKERLPDNIYPYSMENKRLFDFLYKIIEN